MSEKEIDVLSASMALLGKLKLIHAHPKYQKVWETAQGQLGVYDGPSYEFEMDVLTEVIERDVKSEFSESNESNEFVSFYSFNGEDFDYSNPEECAEGEAYEVEPGKVIEIFEQEFIKCAPSHFTPDVAEYMQERAYDECGEAAENWEWDEKLAKALQEEVDDVVQKFCNKHDLNPRLYQATRSKTKTLRYKVLEDGEVEEIKKEEE